MIEEALKVHRNETQFCLMSDAIFLIFFKMSWTNWNLANSIDNTRQQKLGHRYQSVCFSLYQECMICLMLIIYQKLPEALEWCFLEHFHLELFKIQSLSIAFILIISTSYNLLLYQCFTNIFSLGRIFEWKFARVSQKWRAGEKSASSPTVNKVQG